MNVKVIAQATGRHGRAFYMPAWTPPPPGRLPRGFAGFCHFPQHEIQRVAFGGIDIHPLAGLQVFDIFAGQFTVTLETIDRIKYIAIAADLGKTLVYQGLDHIDNSGDGLGGARLLIRWQHRQSSFIFMHGLDKAFGKCGELFLIFSGAMNNFVVYVGHIPHIGQMVTGMPKITGNGIENHHHPGVTDMAIIVDSHAADIHLHLARYDGLKNLF